MRQTSCGFEQHSASERTTIPVQRPIRFGTSEKLLGAGNPRILGSVVANERRVVWFLRRCHCRRSGRTISLTAREQRGATLHFLSLAQNFPACLAFRMASILVSAAEDLLVRLLLQEVVGDRMGGSLPRPFQPACSASFHQNAWAHGGGRYWAQRSEKKNGDSDIKFLF